MCSASFLKEPLEDVRNRSMGPRIHGTKDPQVVKGSLKVTVIPVDNYLHSHNIVDIDYYVNQNSDVIVLGEP